MNLQKTIHALYKKLIELYPAEFKAQLGESMEQTFNDRYIEMQNSQQGMFGFAIRTFAETAVGIFREHLLLVSTGGIMQTLLGTFGLSALISYLFILPFMVMEVVNNRYLNEGFPFSLFFILWLNMLAVSLILLPILRAWRAGNQDTTNPAPAQGSTLITKPGSALMISVVLIIFTLLLSMLSALGWEPLDRLINGPNPEQPYLPGQIFAIALISIPIAAGIIAGRPIVNTLQAGGGLFAHPVHLLIVVVLSFLFAAGVIGLIVDQWPCFMGVPNCD